LDRAKDMVAEDVQVEDLDAVALGQQPGDQHRADVARPARDENRPDVAHAGYSETTLECEPSRQATTLRFSFLASPAPDAVCNFRRHSTWRYSGMRSMERWLPRMATASAPTTLPRNPTSSAGASWATHRDVRANTASPAPTRSTTWAEKAGTC